MNLPHHRRYNWKLVRRNYASVLALVALAALALLLWTIWEQQQVIAALHDLAIQLAQVVEGTARLVSAEEIRTVTVTKPHNLVGGI